MRTRKLRSKKQEKLSKFFSSCQQPTRTEANEKSDGNNNTRIKKRRIGQQNGTLLFGTMRRSGFMKCPMCHRSYPIHRIEIHAVECNGYNNTTTTSRRIHGLDNGENSDRLKRHESSKHILSNDQQSLMTSDNINHISCSSAIIPSQSKLQWRELLNGSTKTSVVDFMPLEDCIEPTCEPIPGLFVFDNFIHEIEETIIMNELDEENRLVATADPSKWKKSNFNGLHEGKRWGVHCNLRDRRVLKEENPLPNFIANILLPKLKRVKCMKGCVPNEANAIDYRKERGDYLKSHVDDRQLSKEAIANISIAG